MQISGKNIIKYVDKAMELPEQFDLGNYLVAAYSCRSPDKQTANEDSVVIIPVNQNSLILAIADGMGGLPAGEDASRVVIDNLVQTLSDKNNQEINLRAAILDSIDRANREILEMKNGSATTLVIAEVQDNILRTYHAGDSMIMLMGNRGKQKYTIIPHSPTGYALEAGVINESQAMRHEEKHLISNYIGSTEMRVEVGPTMQITPRDTLILASDGLSDNLYDKEIIELCRKGDIKVCANSLLAKCQKYMQQELSDRNSHPDDLSFILIRLNNQISR